MLQKYTKDNKRNSIHLARNMSVYVSLDIICSSKLTVIVKLRSGNCSHLGTNDVGGQMEAIVYIA